MTDTDGTYDTDAIVVRCGPPNPERTSPGKMFNVIVVIGKGPNRERVHAGSFATEGEADGRVGCAMEWLGATFGYIEHDGRVLLTCHGRPSSLRGIK